MLRALTGCLTLIVFGMYVEPRLCLFTNAIGLYARLSVESDCLFPSLDLIIPFLDASMSARNRERASAADSFGRGILTD